MLRLHYSLEARVVGPPLLAVELPAVALVAQAVERAALAVGQPPEAVQVQALADLAHREPLLYKLFQMRQLKHVHKRQAEALANQVARLHLAMANIGKTLQARIFDLQVQQVVAELVHILALVKNSKLMPMDLR